MSAPEARARASSRPTAVSPGTGSRSCSKRLKALTKQRETRRKQRRRSETPSVALAGYTNVGKSTLLNALTDGEVSVDNRLFETLDPTTRGFDHEGRRYLVTDTVGFIRRLPHELVEGFASTLEETLSADLVLHVLDASPRRTSALEEMREAVESVLREIGAQELPVLQVLNKVDGVDPLGRRRLANRYPGALQVSALTGEGLDELRAAIAEHFGDRFEDVRLLLPYDEGGRLAELYELGAPIDEREDGPEGVFVRARLPRREIPRFARFLVAEARPAKSRTRRRGDRPPHPAPARRRRPSEPCLRGRRGHRPRRLRVGRAAAGRPGDGRHRARDRGPGRACGARAPPLGPCVQPRHRRAQRARPDRRRLSRRGSCRPVQPGPRDL